MIYLRRRAEESPKGADFQLAKTADFEMAIDMYGLFDSADRGLQIWDDQLATDD